MKKTVVTLIVVLVIASLNIGCAKSNTEGGKIFGVNDIFDDPLAFTGEITLTGVAGVFYAEHPAIFNLVHTTAVLSKDYCCLIAFPVMLPGNLPKPEAGDEINITGSFTKYKTEIGHEYGYGRDIVFEVKKIEVKRNIMHLIS